MSDKNDKPRYSWSEDGKNVMLLNGPPPYYERRADAGLDICMKHTNINTGGNNMTDETDEDRKDRTGLSSLEISEQESVAVAKTKNRVTLDSMKDKVVGEEYINPSNIPHMTICILTVENGFALVGHSAPADPENYDRALGEKFACENALRQLWQLEGYLLRERLSL